MTLDEATALIAAVNSAYTGQPAIVPDRAGLVIRMWLEDLGEYPFEVVWSAFGRYRAGGAAFPPNSGQLRALVLDRANPVLGFAQVWSAISSAISRYGSYRPDDALAFLAGVPGAGELVGAMGGWNCICLGGTDEYTPTPPGVWRSQAEHAWRDIAEAMRRERVLPSLAANEPPRLPSGPRSSLPAPTSIGDVLKAGR